MKIEKVAINNFKCLKDICIALSNLTLITGVNSSGKSSFIQSLLLLKQNQESITKISHSKTIQMSMEHNEKVDNDSLLTNVWLKMIEDSKDLPLLLNVFIG